MMLALDRYWTGTGSLWHVSSLGFFMLRLSISAGVILAPYLLLFETLRTAGRLSYVIGCEANWLRFKLPRGVGPV